MKKALSLLLVLVLCLSLCACGKSSEAQAVDDMILALGEVSLDDAAAVEAAAAAYQALSEKDRKSVENYALLEQAQGDLFYAMFFDLTNRLLEIYYNSQDVTDGTRIIWNNVGSSDFWASYNAVRLLNIDMSKAEYDELFMELNGTKAFATIWCAARGLCPSNIHNTNQMTDQAQEDTIDLCLAFNNCYNIVNDLMDPLAEEIRVFKNKYKKYYEDEVNSLNDLYLEVSMYADFALTPEGSLNSYTSTDQNYQNSINRLIKIVDSYK